MTGKLNDYEIEHLLLSQVMGRMACSDEHQPYIVPLTYTYDGEYIYGQTPEGRKLTIMRKNPRICFEVDMMSDMVNWKSVIVYGSFEELQNEEALKAKEIMLNRVRELSTSTTFNRNVLESAEVLEEDLPIPYVMYRIKILKATGRFENA